jgi:hypothetical protein
MDAHQGARGHFAVATKPRPALGSRPYCPDENLDDLLGLWMHPWRSTHLDVWS